MIEISTIFKSLQQQQLPALIKILEKGRDYAHQHDVKEQALIEQRLFEDMHPLRWQVQTVLELALRSAARITHQDLPSLDITDNSFEGLISHVHAVSGALSKFDAAVMDLSASEEFEIPIGPETKLTMTGESYVLKFFYPTFIST